MNHPAAHVLSQGGFLTFFALLSLCGSFCQFLLTSLLSYFSLNLPSIPELSAFPPKRGVLLSLPLLVFSASLQPSFLTASGPPAPTFQRFFPRRATDKHSHPGREAHVMPQMPPKPFKMTRIVSRGHSAQQPFCILFNEGTEKQREMSKYCKIFGR